MYKLCCCNRIKLICRTVIICYNFAKDDIKLRVYHIVLNISYVVTNIFGFKH